MEGVHIYVWPGLVFIHLTKIWAIAYSLQSNADLKRNENLTVPFFKKNNINSYLKSETNNIDNYLNHLMLLL